MESERDRKVRERAYELWVQGGRRSDSSEQDWAQAEQEYAAGSESPDVEAAAAPAKKTRAKAAAPDVAAASKPSRGPAKKAAGAEAPQPTQALQAPEAPPAKPAAAKRGPRASGGKTASAEG